MKYMRPVTMALLLTAFSAGSASAQAPALTNADVIRLIAMRVSEQTVIAVIHEAKATQFDLSPQAVSELTAYQVSTAVVAVMRQSSTPTPILNGIAAPNQSPASGAQTLAGAAAEAAKVAHPSEQGDKAPKTSYTIDNRGAPAPPAPSAAAPNTAPVAAVVKDKAYWKEQLRPAVVAWENAKANTKAASAIAKLYPLGSVAGYRAIVEARRLQELESAQLSNVISIADAAKQAGVDLVIGEP